MILSRTPLRVSFFGGGTDYPEYCDRMPGTVVGMTINKHVYISAIELENFLPYRYRISYSAIEAVNSHDEIEHPVVRALLKHFDYQKSLDISIFADLPGRSGLGGSSAFTVGCINLLHALQGKTCTRNDLARTAIYTERELLAENVGMQDQMHAAFGGINKFTFEGGRVGIHPLQMRAECLDELTSSLVLIFTGITRSASMVLDEQIAGTKTQTADADLFNLIALAEHSVSVLEGDDPETLLVEFGAMMHEGWMTKKKLSSKISNPAINALYEAALDAGATGGKLCGAGAGGFLLMVVPRHNRPVFDERMAEAAIIPINLDTHGSVIMRMPVNP